MTDLLGQTIGNCRLEAPLGAGGMGRVFRAHHIHLDRPQALKVLHDQVALDQGFQARFRLEARTLAALEHPNIVKLYEAGEDRGRFFLSMEFLPDGSLRGLLERRAKERQQWRDEERQQWRVVGLDLARQAAEALAFAHKQGIVHRDIKPDNLLLARQRRPDGSSSFQLKVGDFGLAQLADTGGLTASGFTVGTPAYMSPEQCQGQELDARTDIYSLGVVLYEMLTGYLPFAAKTTSDIILKHIQATPRPPRELDPTLSAEVEAVLMRCLAKRPAERFASLDELAAALRTLIEAATGSHQLTPLPTAAPPTGFRIKVVDASGRVLRTVALPEGGLSVGRMAGNDLVLDDPTVSRSHLRIGRGRTRARATDLGARGGTQLGGTPLPPFAEQPWPIGQLLQVGPFTLHLEPATPARLVIALPGGANPLKLTPGEPAFVSALLSNQGGQTDTVTFAVEGVPAGWVRLPKQPLVLEPEGSATLALAIGVPFGPAGQAGDYQVTLRARPAAAEALAGELATLWRVVAVPDAHLSVNPPEVVAGEQGSFTITLSNTGNAPARYQLSGHEQSGALRFVFVPNSVELAPGQTATIGLTINAKRRMLGRRRSYPFVVRAEAPELMREAAAIFTQDGPLLF